MNLCAVNCFQAELPSVICDAISLEVLSLNGLGAAEGCLNTLQFPFSGVKLLNTIGGTLPACVWDMESLSTLHLTGNGLTGITISELPQQSPMADLSLSHNKFSGEIPLNMHLVERLDLFHNQFFGEYDRSSVWMNELVDMEINRLSGQLSVSKMENVSDMNVLRGNMFSCDSIPANDEHSSDYICGSENLNESLYVFCSALLAVGSSVLVVWQAARLGASPYSSSSKSFAGERCRQVHRYITSVQRLESAVGALQPVASLCVKLKEARWLFVRLLAVMLLIVAPIYCVRGSDGDALYSTHSETYSWFWTLAYLHGVVPSGLILGSWCVTVATYFYIVLIEDSGHLFSSSILLSSGVEADHLKVKTWVAGALFINGVVTIVVNAVYMYGTQQHLSAFALFGLQLSLAVFRLGYAYLAVPFLSRPVSDLVSNLSFRFLLLIVNNLVIPCLVTAFASPSCFQVTTAIS